ncbi:MAG TPA: SpoIIIAH-like family protein [Candidatus Avamphibacillus intestinigallinarum]|nr:SpoIIIAH-like family protein [Candidatus Avamphibacillus intestinigallinarum]
MLKKQTVWLLTMLSLIIVLSAYYMLSPNNGDLAYIDQGEDETETTSGEAKTKKDQLSEKDEKGDVTDVENVGQDELFTTIRMELQDERSKKEDRLNEVIASSSTSTEEKNQALEDINDLENASTKETILQDSIMSLKEKYQDVLVRSEKEKVHVHVKVDKLSKGEVIEIMQLVRDEFGDKKVDVNYQSTDK